MPTVARVAGGTLRYESAPLPAWPPPERSHAALNQRRRAGDGELLAWDPAQYKQLPRLLAKDRRRSLGARIAYYESKGLLRPGDGFVRYDRRRPPRGLVSRRRQQGGVRAFDRPRATSTTCPRSCCLSPMPAMIGATSRTLALTVNAIADAMIGGGVRLAPGDRYAAVADIVARTVHKECTLDHASLAQSCFVIPSPRIEERTLGVGAWFYANFMDAPSFPVLACLLQPPRVPDGYGVPPPPRRRGAPPQRRRRDQRPRSKGDDRRSARAEARRGRSGRAEDRDAQARPGAARSARSPGTEAPAPKRPPAKKAVKKSRRGAPCRR